MSDSPTSEYLIDGPAIATLRVHARSTEEALAKVRAAYFERDVREGSIASGDGGSVRLVAVSLDDSGFTVVEQEDA